MTERGEPRLRAVITTACIGAFVGLLACREKSNPRPTPRPTPASDAASPSPAPKRGLRVAQSRIVGQSGERAEPIFGRGETVTFRMLLRGITHRQRRVHLTSTLVLRAPGGEILLRRPRRDAVNQSVPPGRSVDVLEVGVRTRLTAAHPPGEYRATVEVRDAFSRSAVRQDFRFRVLGQYLAKTPKQLQLRHFEPSPDADLAPGLPLVVRLEATGFASEKSPAPPFSHTVRLTASTKLFPTGGGPSSKPASVHQATLLERKFRFRPHTVACELRVPVPAQLPPGRYKLVVSIRDLAGGGRVQRTHEFRLFPRTLGVYTLRAFGAGLVPRRAFARGDRIQVRFRVTGYTKPSNVSVDVGIVGPDKGFYLVRKNRPLGGKPGASVVPVESAFTVHEFMPHGRYQFRVRVRDRETNRTMERVLVFRVVGRRIPPLPALRVVELTLRRRPGGPPLAGLFLRAGQALQFDLVVGGLRPRLEQGLYHRVDLTCTLRLRDARGALKATKRGACRVSRRFSFLPRRLRLHASWRLPATALGKHQLQVEVHSRLTDRVSVLNRTLFILRRRR